MYTDESKDEKPKATRAQPLKTTQFTNYAVPPAFKHTRGNVGFRSNAKKMQDNEMTSDYVIGTGYGYFLHLFFFFFLKLIFYFYQSNSCFAHTSF